MSVICLTCLACVLDWLGERTEAAATKGAEESEASRDHGQAEETEGADRKQGAGLQRGGPGR